MLVVVTFLTKSVVVTFLADLEVVFAFLAENVVDEQLSMGAHFVSQCFVVICVGLLLVIALRILVVAFLVFMFRILRVHLLTFIIILEVVWTIALDMFLHHDAFLDVTQCCAERSIRFRQMICLGAEHLEHLDAHFECWDEAPSASP